MKVVCKNIILALDRKNHNSTLATRTYANFRFIKLYIDFPSLGKSNHSLENWEMEHRLMRYKPSANPLNATLLGS